MKTKKSPRIAHNRNARGDAAREYLERYPHQPTRTIARLVFEELTGLFDSVEQARSILKDHRTARGGTCGGKFLREHGSQSDCVIPLPPPIPDGEPWHIVPIDFKLALNLADLHVPFHDPTAVDIAIRYGKKLGVDCIIIGGDLMDFYAASSWERDPRLRSLKKELDLGERFIEVLRDTFPKAQIIYQEGNHEERLWRYAWRNMPELAKLPELTLKELLHLSDYGVQLIDGKKPILAGPHLHLLHGHEFGGFMTNPVNPARGLFLRAKVNAVCNHFHQTSSHTEPGLGHPVSTWSGGCLCNLHPRYRPINKWNHGFMVLELHRNAWSVTNKKIIGREVV